MKKYITLLIILILTFLGLGFLSGSVKTVYAACTPGAACGECTAGTCSNGAACASGHTYCVWNAKGNYCGSCQKEVDNCASQCSSGTAPITNPSASAGCNVCATWNSDCQNKSLTCDVPGEAKDSRRGTDCTNTCTSWRWDNPCGSTGETRSVWHVCVLDCNRSPSDPKCGSCNLNSQYLTPDLGAACTSCIANSTSSTGWNARGAINYVKGSMGTAYAACTDQKVVNYMCNGGVSAQDKADCLGSKNGVCASACSGSQTPPGPSSPPGSTISPADHPTCKISGPGSITRGGKLAFTAQTNDSKARSMEIYYTYPGRDMDKSVGWTRIAYCDLGINGDCKAEINTGDPNAIPADKDQVTAICNVYNWKATATATNKCPADTTDVTHCGPDGMVSSEAEWPNYVLANACSGNPRTSSAWSYCGDSSNQKVAIVPPPTPPPPPVTTTKFRFAENPTDLKTAPWQDYTASIASAPFDYTFKDATPGQKFIFVQFMDSNGTTTTAADCPKCQAQIKLFGPDPTMTGCSLGLEGNHAILNLTGQNFGSDKGTVKSGDSDLQIKSWKDDSIQAVLQNAPTGQVLPVTFTNTDGQTGTGQCSSISQLSLGAKVFCRAPASFDTDNVDLVLVDETGKKMRQAVKIDKNGVVQGLTQRLEDGKKYTLSLKAPKSLRRTVTFTAGGGTVNLPNFVLPIGDIFPVDGGDGVINSFDHDALVRQWNISTDATNRTGDFNQDGRVNSIDWACMRYDFGDKDDPEPVPGKPASSSINPVVDFYRCTSDKECISIRADGCDCSAGGKATSINKQYSKEWEDSHPRQVCPAVTSSDWTCVNAIAKCMSNECKLISPDVNQPVKSGSI